MAPVCGSSEGYIRNAAETNWDLCLIRSVSSKWSTQIYCGHS